MQGHSCFAVVAGGAFAVFKRQSDCCKIAERDDTVAFGFDRQVVDVARLVKGRWDFDGKGALLRLNRTCGDQQIVLRDHVDQLGCGDVVGLKPQRVDHDLEHFVALSRERGLKYSVDAFEPVLQIFGNVDQRAFRQFARQVHDDDRKFGKVDLVN